MDLSVIVVTWNSEKFIAQCLRSCAKASPGLTHEIIVVDNASSDRTGEVVRKEFPGTRLIELSSNEGFARACNRGFLASQGTSICFVNPDTEVFGASLTNMVRFLERSPSAGMVGGQLQNPDGSIQPSVRAFPTPLIAYGLALKLHRIPGVRRWFNGYYLPTFDYARAQSVDQVMGAFFMAPKDFLVLVRGFDERYFIWFEEVDLMRQAKQRGREVWYYPEAQAVHLSGQSFGQVEVAVNQKRFLESMMKYVAKWHGFAAMLPLMIMMPLIVSLYKVREIIVGKFRTRV